jgi:predicted phosphate transport protein (TIGR00153 family)
MGRATSSELFGLVAEGGGNALRAALLLEELLTAWPDRPELLDEIVACEHEGDRITHDVLHGLHRARSMPVDREDLHRIATVLDDVVDLVEEAADHVTIYKIEAPMQQAVELTGVLRDACRNLDEALSRLPRPAETRPYAAEIRRLEHEGDRITRAAIGALFANGIDPMTVIRWKDVIERLEQAVDACKRVAHTLESIAVKHG